MRKYSLGLAILALASLLAAQAEKSDVRSVSDQFVIAILNDFAKASSCRKEFDPAAAVGSQETHYGRQRKWSEMDRREPDTENHMLEWNFPGFRLVTSTHFGYYGPSTWLHSLQLTSPTAISDSVRFGQSVSEFAKGLKMSERDVRSAHFNYESAYVTFEIGDDDTVQSLLLECIAD